jgi:hypothetical protein
LCALPHITIKVYYDIDVVKDYYRDHGIDLEAELRFDPDRDWRFDFTVSDPNPYIKIAIEVQGGIWTGGAHARGAGVQRDMQKYSTAASQGWLILLVQPSDICMDDTLELVKATVANRQREIQEVKNDHTNGVEEVGA